MNKCYSTIPLKHFQEFFSGHHCVVSARHSFRPSGASAKAKSKKAPRTRPRCKFQRMVRYLNCPAAQGRPLSGEPNGHTDPATRNKTSSAGPW